MFYSFQQNRIPWIAFKSGPWPFYESNSLLHTHASRVKVKTILIRTSAKHTISLKYSHFEIYIRKKMKNYLNII